MWDKFFWIAENQSENPALLSDELQLTYSELLNLAKKLAASLQQRNLSQACIGIALKSKAEEAIAALAVLLSGNYFFFLPHQQGKEVLDHVPIALILTDIESFESLPVATCSMSDLKDSVPALEPWWKNENNWEDRFFCVYATSGSTGSAKYVLHDYRSIVEDTDRQIEENHISSKDRIDFLFAASFSSSLASIFPAWLSGAALVVHAISEQGLEQIPRFWKKYEVTMATLTSTAFRGIVLLLGNRLSEFTASIRFLCLGGEPIQASDLKLVSFHFPDSVLLQLAYASTETRTIAETSFSPKNTQFDQIQDGIPVRKKQVKLLDDTNAEVNQGEVGEIVVYSPYISLGYWFQRKILFHPANDQNRIYHTGDLGFFNKEGALKLVGRNQSQQKVNGVFVDVSRIREEIYLAQPQITECKVLVVHDAHGFSYLVAFILSQESWSEHAIREHFHSQSHLTTAPRLYVPLDIFPMNAHGKLDRISLEKIANEHALKARKLQIQDTTTKLVYEIWTRELNLMIDRLDADFFLDLGGNSMLAAFIIEELSKELSKELPLQMIHTYRTISLLSRAIQELDEPKFPVLEISKRSGNQAFPWLLFLESGYYDSLSPLREQLEASPQFSTATLRIDIFAILKGKSSASILEELENLLMPYTNAYLIGSSFNGWLAAKVASKLGFGVILLDSPFYSFGTEGPKLNRSNRSRVNYLKGLFIQRPISEAIQKTFELFWGFAKKNAHATNEEKGLFNQSVHEFLRQTTPIEKVSNLLLVYSNLSMATSLQDIELWKQKTVDKFEILRIQGGHLDAYSPKFIPEVSQKINEFILLK